MQLNHHITEAISPPGDKQTKSLLPKRKSVCIEHQSTPSKHKSAKLTRLRSSIELRSSRVGEADECEALGGECSTGYPELSCFFCRDITPGGTSLFNQLKEYEILTSTLKLIKCSTVCSANRQDKTTSPQAVLCRVSHIPGFTVHLNFSIALVTLPTSQVL